MMLSYLMHNWAPQSKSMRLRQLLIVSFYFPYNGAHRGTQTPSLRVRSAMLYSVELGVLWRRQPDLNWHLKDLQSRALPFCYVSIIGSGGWARTNSLVSQSHLRYQLRHSRINWYPIPESNWRSHLERVAS